MLKQAASLSQVNNFNNNIPVKAKELISRELKLCRSLRALISRELEAIIIDGDMDELFRIMSQKSEIVSQLQLLADSWRDLLSESGIDFNANPVNFGGQILNLFPDDLELRDLVNQTHEVANSIINAEDEAINELEKYSSGVRSQVAQRIQGKNAAASYARMGGSII